MALRGPRSPPSPHAFGFLQSPGAQPTRKQVRPAPRGPRLWAAPEAFPDYPWFPERFPHGPLRGAEPVVREGLKHISEACVFIYCQVGEKPYWKDPNNDFRTNLKITAVPTLLKYGTPQKLVESECLQANLVEMLFTED
ncbi:PREDICTED: thioredoxin domain-containing protein 17 isoform X3 [Myotis davidii]|uniref:thioredoxin domain-containing protein 17 isoform X3 n=1 Tax=Myotis davidii TaxID=225400 RepID=UPI000767BC8D|nr:PREDICTED: thioredoxin domain-containing protein 17 isoform X3 [Myotis davidii]